MTFERPIRLFALLAACAAPLALPGTAGADADPASDTLLAQNYFTSYGPTVSPGLIKALSTLTDEAQRAGFPIKVAVVATATDLGGVPDQFGHPQNYAQFLASEISFNRKQPVLVVMPAGIGTANVPNANAINGLAISSGSGSDGLAQTALSAVQKLAKANGHPLKAPSVASGGGSGGVSPVIAYGAPVVLLVLAALLIGLGRRRLPDEEEDEQEEEDGQHSGARR